MARLRGSNAEYNIHQWANDWVSVDARDDSVESKNRVKVVSPRSLYLEPDESARLRHDYEAYLRDPSGHHAGYFWYWWKLSDDGERLVPARKRAQR